MDFVVASALVLGSCLAAGYATILFLRIGSRDSALPPGPPTLPLLGNIHNLPGDHMYLKLTEWARQYGGIFTLKLASQNFIVVSDAHIERILMEHKSATTSDRPPSYIVNLVTEGKHSAFARYGPDWRRSRRVMHEWFNKEACQDYTRLHQAEITQLLRDILHEPERLYEHAFRHSNSLITSIVAGIRSPRWDSPLVTIIHRTMRIWSTLSEPAVAPPLDMIPILRYVPERWAKWKTNTRVLRELQEETYGAIIRHCEDRIKQGDPCRGVLEKVLPTLEERGMDQASLQGTVAAILEGASGTASDFIRTCVFLFVTHPWVQKKAQEELDRVVGTGRCPTLQDCEHLPYCRAVVSEVNRYRPVAPLTAPHYAMQDEVVDGYHIPKGSTIVVNMYGIFHDPAAFDEPERFNPDRFMTNELGLKPGASDEGHRPDMCFGAGRRICGGIQFAGHIQALVTINLLWAFHLEEATDLQTGEKIPVHLDNFDTGLTTGPGPFQYSVRLRNPEQATIIEEGMASAHADVFQGLDEDGIPKDVFEKLQGLIKLLN